MKYVICTDVFGKKHKFPVEKLRFRPSVYGIVFKAGKVLLVPTWDGYDFPGGGVEPGETFEKSLKREVFEETGLRVDSDKLIHFGESFFIFNNNSKPRHSLLFYYLCKNPRGVITDKFLTGFERTYVKKAVWVDYKKALRLKYYNSVDALKLLKLAKKL